jgi:hypothetical protein
MRQKIEKWMMKGETLRYIYQLLATEYGHESMFGDRLPNLHFASTNNLAVLSPLAIETAGLIDPKTALILPGVPIGACGPGGYGGMALVDGIQLWQHGLVTNLNGFKLGTPGTRKSTETKFELFIGAVFGYNQLVLDRTGEYTAVVELIKRMLGEDRARILRFSGDSITGAEPDVYINPLDPILGDLQEIRYPLITALVLIGMGQEEDGHKGHYRFQLPDPQDTLLWEAIADVEDDRKASRIQVPLLEHLEEKLFEPTPRMLQAVRRSKNEVKKWCFPMALAVRKLTKGKLKGSFHKPTTPGALEAQGLTVLNCQGQKDDRVVITTLIQNIFIHSKRELLQDDPRKRIHIIKLDEVWDMLVYPHVMESLLIAYKQSGKHASFIESTMHNEQDAEVATSNEQAVRGFFADSDIRKFYRMNRGQLVARQDVLGLSDTEVDIIAGSKDGSRTGLPDGSYLLKLKDRPGKIIQQQLEEWPELLTAADTRKNYRRDREGRIIARDTPLPLAQEKLDLEVAA